MKNLGAFLKIGFTSRNDFSLPAYESIAINDVKFIYSKKVLISDNEILKFSGLWDTQVSENQVRVNKIPNSWQLERGRQKQWVQSKGCKEELWPTD